MTRPRSRLRPTVQNAFLQLFVLWWSRYGATIAGRVHVEHKLVDGKRETCLVIPRQPTPRGDTGRARYVFTTIPQALLPDRFDPTDVAEIRDAVYPTAKGRVVFCTDSSTGDVLCAVSYHFPPLRTEPLLMRRIAIRTDALAEESFLCAIMIKVHLHEFGRRTKATAVLQFECSPAEATVYRRIGLKRVGAAGAFGRHLLEQEAFRLLP